MKNVYIVGAARTAVGSIGKSLKNISAEELGSSVISNVLKRSKITSNDIDEVQEEVQELCSFRPIIYNTFMKRTISDREA